jgi:hypothetical protein
MITVPPLTTPVVTVLCACAAIGAAIAPAITAMASILFRMVNSLAKMSLGCDAFSQDENAMLLARRASADCEPMHRARHRSPKMLPHTRQFRAIFAKLEPLEATGVFYSHTAPAGKLSSIRFIPNQPETSR